LKRIVVGCLAIIGFLSIALAVTGAVGIWYWQKSARVEKVEGPVILALDLRGRLPEESQDLFPFSRLGDAAPTVLEIVQFIDRGAVDERVRGLFAIIDDTAHGWASAQEIRNAIVRFRASGKPGVVHATSFGELGPANEGYFLASAFDSIQVQPGGLVGLTGLSIVQPSARALLDRVGITPNVIRRSEYKSVFDALTEYEISAPNREMLTAMLRSFERQIVGAIAADRQIEPTNVRELIDRGPLTAQEALEAGLIDKIAYEHEVEFENLPDAEVLSPWTIWPQEADERHETRSNVALIAATGMIFQGSSRPGDGIGSDTLAQKLADAIDDPLIDGIVLRLDSGGGSAVASETIASQFVRARDMGKPVVVSMSNVAASGGYWIAQAADRIIAQPMTITGSIGVILGKPSLEALWAELGVSWAEISMGNHAGMWSLNQPYSNSERARLETLIDSIYMAFKNRVAESRGLDLAAVEALARGRVWTGEQALEIGLVDGLGGIELVRAEMAGLLGLDDPDAMTLLPYPPPPGPFERLESLLEGDLSPGFGFDSFWKRWVRIANPGPVTMTPIIVR
jgi:protease-4